MEKKLKFIELMSNNLQFRHDAYLKSVTEQKDAYKIYMFNLFFILNFILIKCYIYTEKLLNK